MPGVDILRPEFFLYIKISRLGKNRRAEYTKKYYYTEDHNSWGVGESIRFHVDLPFPKIKNECIQDKERIRKVKPAGSIGCALNMILS